MKSALPKPPLEHLPEHNWQPVKSGVARCTECNWFRTFAKYEIYHMEEGDYGSTWMPPCDEALVEWVMSQ